MADAQTPGGYFIGRPANYEDNQQTPDATNGSNTVSAPDDGGNHVQTSSASGDQKKPGIFGNLFSCFSGGRVAS